MLTDHDIRETYRKLNSELATHNAFLNRWSSNSQYGYVFDWFDTEGEAEEFALEYYRAKPHLILQ